MFSFIKQNLALKAMSLQVFQHDVGLSSKRDEEGLLLLAKKREWDLRVKGFGSIQINTGALIQVLKGPRFFSHCSSSHGKRPGESVTTTFIEFYNVFP